MQNFSMEGSTIPHEVTVHWDGAKLLFKPVPNGTGLIAGSKPRDILVMAGIKDVMVKSLGSSNPINLVKATFKALTELKTRESIRKSRGIQ
jgi:small subunit ribosomal protein S5